MKDYLFKLDQHITDFSLEKYNIDFLAERVKEDFIRQLSKGIIDNTNPITIEDVNGGKIFRKELFIFDRENFELFIKKQKLKSAILELNSLSKESEYVDDGDDSEESSDYPMFEGVSIIHFEQRISSLKLELTQLEDKLPPKTKA